MTILYNGQVATDRERALIRELVTGDMDMYLCGCYQYCLCRNPERRQVQPGDKYTYRLSDKVELILDIVRSATLSNEGDLWEAAGFGDE